jgi:hypothetical protein
VPVCFDLCQTLLFDGLHRKISKNSFDFFKTIVYSKDVGLMFSIFNNPFLKGVKMMISEKQWLANQHNALRSTGPRSPAGKALASQNALRHGLRAGRSIIAGEHIPPPVQVAVECL